MWHPAAEPLVALRGFQEVDDLGQLRLGLVDPGDVIESDPDLLRIDPPCLAASEVPEPSQPAARGHCARRAKSTNKPDQQQRWPEPEQQLRQQRGPGFGFFALTSTPLD